MEETPLESRYSLFDQEERVMLEAEHMVRLLNEMADGVKRLAEAYRQGYNEQRRLVRLSDRMLLELHGANQQLAEKTRALTELNEALAQEVGERARLADELQRIAVTDELTGAHNRRHLFELAEQELRRAERHARPLCLLAIDLDHFKTVNDEFGHAAGDAALRAFADLCRNQLRASDLFGRIGGEEFTLVLPETDAAMGAQLAERLRSAVRSHEICNQRGCFRLSISIGGTEIVPGDSFEGALARADDALYAAKHAGRNCVIFFPATGHEGTEP